MARVLHESWLRGMLGLGLSGLLLLAPAAPREALAQVAAAQPTKRKGPDKAATSRKPITLRQDKTQLVSFVTAPFPFDGTVPTTGRPFLDIEEGERRGHKGLRGQTFWADEVYDDSRVLLHLPKGFNAQKPGMIVVFFHGHGATLERDVLRRQQVAAQLTRSGLNAALVAPQFATDAPDSSAGKFWEPGNFLWFMEEAAQQLAALYGDTHSAAEFARMPIVFVAYSGGYLPAAYALQSGGAGKRLRAILLLDALYGDIEKFTNWITRNRSGVFVSAFTHHTADNNIGLQKTLKERNLVFDTELRRPLRPGTIAFVASGVELTHRNFVTEAWTEHPVRDFLRALTELR